MVTRCTRSPPWLSLRRLLSGLFWKEMGRASLEVISTWRRNIMSWRLFGERMASWSCKSYKPDLVVVSPSQLVNAVPVRTFCPEVQGWFLSTEVELGPFADHSLLFGRFRVPGLPEPRTVWSVPVHRPPSILKHLRPQDASFAVQVCSQGAVTSSLPGQACRALSQVSPSETYRLVCSEYEARLDNALRPFAISTGSNRHAACRPCPRT